MWRDLQGRIGADLLCNGRLKRDGDLRGDGSFSGVGWGEVRDFVFNGGCLGVWNGSSSVVSFSVD